MRSVLREPEEPRRPFNLIHAWGIQFLALLREAGVATLILLGGLAAVRFLVQPRARRELVRQLYLAGVKSLPVVTVVGMFTGMILSLQTGLALRRFGQEVNIGTAVMVSMLREMGPFMTGLILAASVGSSMAAQLGTMTISEEIAALEIMSIAPIRFLVMPRLWALAVMGPLLSFYASMMGVVGGGVVGLTQLGVPWSAYWDNATLFAENKDLWVGMLKALCFCLIIATIACHQGFAARKGALGVGEATRQTVILSFLLILMTGYFLTRLFYV
jgi:phospholipid/cholesterol/gamma-HCH transport system permease protein